MNYVRLYSFITMVKIEKLNIVYYELIELEKKNSFQMAKNFQH